MEYLVGIIGHLAWPVTILVLAYLARNELKKIITSISERIGQANTNVSIGKEGIKLEPRLQEQFDLVKDIEQNPQDKNAQYRLIDSLLDPVIRQHLILMEEFNVEIPYEIWGRGHTYKFGTERKNNTVGQFDPNNFNEKLKGTGFIELTTDTAQKLKLTAEGKEFANWLIENGRKEDFMVTEYGSWGEPWEFPLSKPTPES